MIDTSIAFIGGGNMAAALAGGLAGKVVSAERIHVLDPNVQSHDAWRARGASVAAQPDEALARAAVWVYAVKPQIMKEVVAQTRPWLRDTLVISVAAGLRGDTLAGWLGEGGQPHGRVIRCMPNTPALIGAGASGLAAQAGVGAADRKLATTLLSAVGEVTWVADDAALDAVTALSGSGPAYVFLVIQALIDGGVSLGLSAEQARQLALATLAGATRLAAESDESPEVLRQRVTSKGGTTAAAIGVMQAQGLEATIARAMRAAAERAREMGQEFGA
ncbi:pyrroline-5-carboxylate reductase [Verticiella sediminum]|uniref:Pyrroline-5-carboxylate reductase n=1 Tax=Verticiella sediminum TaxID=1247510 RepID=A0A556ADQ8_9BURK|nr:pyrroline-5-carboxylate reductase [Verticiella sediminum]TSH91028.1 pyrroline-5-carboxylate reductase [Verticiella sediminum]